MYLRMSRAASPTLTHAEDFESVLGRGETSAQ